MERLNTVWSITYKENGSRHATMCYSKDDFVKVTNKLLSSVAYSDVLIQDIDPFKCYMVDESDSKYLYKEVSKEEYFNK